jgi:hypothetical protein
MAMRPRHLAAAIVVVALAGALALLRDPPWLAAMTTGMKEWTVDADGRRVRWLDGRSSFFVPSDARAVRLPLRTTFDTPGDWPIQVTISLDGRPGERLILRDAAWHMVEIRLPPPGSRRHRRIDIHLDRLRAERRGALLGEVELR